MIRIQSEAARTARRMERLEAYARRHLIAADGTFVCPHHEACRASRLWRWATPA